VTVFEQVADSLRAQGLTVVTTIPNAVPPPEFPSGPESPHEKFRIGYVGRLEAVKGLDRLTELIPQLDDQRFAVVIAGAGSWEPRLRALARRCPALTLLPFTDDVGGILRELDLLLYPTRAAGEGLPLIILEAFHHGIPVIARAHGGIPAVVKHDVNGILLAEDTADAYAGAIRELAGDDARYRRLADGARATVAGPFAFTRHCAAYRERIMLALTTATLPYRVAYISGEDRLDHGGGAHTVEMAAALAARAAGVDLIVPRRFPVPAPGLLPANVRIIRAPLKLFGKTFLPRGLGALRQLRLTPPGLIIERYYCTGSLGAVLARQTGAPLVSEANHPHHREVQRRYRLPGWLADRLALRVLAPATAIIAPTPKLVPAPLRARVLTLPWGVNRARFHRISAGQFAATPRTVVFSGSFQPWHGVELLVATMRRTLADPLHWLIVGMGAREADFRGQCRQAGIPADRCTIIPSLPYAQMPELLARGCLGFAPYDPERHPAYRETGFYWTPFKILEYLATGLPVVTTDAPVLQALVAERGFGLCVPPDAEALAQAVRRLATEPAAWQAAHAAIARDFTDAYSWDAFVRHLLARMQSPG
ncbi:MAG TPA: glycosyltransferase, partial [bacterium]|nr:glycosyltransferase [bacterium]